jgi:hypothetical protein
MELAKHCYQRDEVLARRVVQLPGDPPSLFVLRAQELSGAASQLLFGLLSIFNIRVRPVPPHDASFRISQWYATCQEPTVRPVGRPMAFFLFVRRSIHHGLVPSPKHPISIVGMKYGLPAIASQVFQL